MVARLTRPTRVMGEDGRFVGIQIVYGQPFTLTLYPGPNPGPGPNPVP